MTTLTAEIVTEGVKAVMVNLIDFEAKAAACTMLTPAELALELGLCTDTVLRWRAGEGPVAIRVGPRSIRYRRTDVDAWIAARADRPTKAGE